MVDITQQVDDLFGSSNDADLASWVSDLTKKKAEASALDKECDDLKNKIVAKLKELGTTSMKVAGRRIGLSSRDYYGIDKEQLPAAKAWIEAVAPEVNVPAAANVGKAVEAFLAQNPGAELPAFIKVTTTETFTNAKA